MGALSENVTTAEEIAQPIKGRSLWQDAWRRLLRNRMAVAGGCVVGIMIIIALLAPFISPYGFDQTDLPNNFQAPSFLHWMGTDNLGRDLLTRVMWGARISLAVGVVSTFVSLLVGVSYGAIAGFIGGKVDNFMMRVADILYSLPYMFFVIILMVIAGRNIINLFIALGLVQWLTMARIVRGQVLSLKEKDYVEAARASGASNFRLIFRHLVPNALGPVIVYSTLTVPAVMLEEAFLSFLGLGVQAPMASWGSLASDGARAVTTYPWLIIFPGIALAATLFSLNFLGDGLRDALDPQTRS
jgi:oligopeptide transport system permease protein